jgi:release factor glutamine methyltransferase
VSGRIELRVGDLFAPWEPGRRFDVIVSNPPYVAESEAADLPANVRDFEPHAALFAGDDGLDILRRLIAEAPRHLKPDGHLMTEVAWNQSAAVLGLLDESVWADIVTYRDTARHERVVHARRHASEQTQVA